MNPKGPLLFDSHALLKFFQKEPGHEQVASLLDHARRTYQVPQALRDFIVARDRTCRFPG